MKKYSRLVKETAKDSFLYMIGFMVSGLILDHISFILNLMLFYFLIFILVFLYKFWVSK